MIPTTTTTSTYVRFKYKVEVPYGDRAEIGEWVKQNFAGGYMFDVGYLEFFISVAEDRDYGLFILRWQDSILRNVSIKHFAGYNTSMVF